MYPAVSGSLEVLLRFFRKVFSFGVLSLNGFWFGFLIFLIFFEMNIYVGNISFRVAEQQLRGLFEQYGEVTNVKLVTDHETGRSKGFAFVEMEGDDEARQAIEALNGFEFQERSLVVNEARPKSDTGGGFKKSFPPRNGGGNGGGGNGGGFRPQNRDGYQQKSWKKDY
ncbi:MAG: RNA-binding protein [Saprospiraceae bacterium]